MSARVRPVRFRIATANLGRHVTVRRFIANVVVLVRALVGAVICLQEIDEDDLPDEHRIIGRRMRKRWSFAGARTRVLIAVPKRTWEIASERVTHGSDGIGGVSPERKIVTAVIRHRRTGLKVAVVNTHAAYPNPRHRRSQQVAAREAQDQLQVVLAAEAARLVDKGLTTLVLGDMNNRRAPKPHPGARMIVGAGGIDYIWVIEGQGPVAVDVKVRRTRTIDLTIDGHNAHVAVVDLYSRAA